MLTYLSPLPLLPYFPVTYCCPRYIFFALDGRRKGGVPKRVVHRKVKMNPSSMMMLAMMLTETLPQLPSTILYTQLHNMFIIIIIILL